MRVLVACEFSGVVRNAFLRRGHDAYSCDILPALWLPCPKGRHFRQDVRPLLKMKWDLVIAHPPCTYLSNSGVRWLTDNPKRVSMMKKGAAFFLDCLNANSSSVCVENPIQHRYAREVGIPAPSQILQPWQFGHGETKAICLWLCGLPALAPTNVVIGREHRIHKMPKTPSRGIMRSIFYDGLASAMADQWGSLGEVT